MKLLQYALILGSITTSSPSVSYADLLKGFECKEINHVTHELMQGKLTVQFSHEPQGLDITQLVTPQGTSTFYSVYNYAKTPHYRWGYAEEFESTLIASDSAEPIGNVKISIEYQGPGYSEGGYIVRGIPGSVEFASPANNGTSFLSFACKALY